jgi:hypothetical protein
MANPLDTLGYQAAFTNAVTPQEPSTPQEAITAPVPTEESNYDRFLREKSYYSKDYQDKYYGNIEEALGPSQADRLAALEERKAKKLSALGAKNQFQSLTDGYTELDNGLLESNSNKIWNDLSGAEFQSVFDYAVNNASLGKDDQGYFYISTGERYEGPVRRSYGYGTKDSDQAYKFGVARGDRDSSDSRYTDYVTGDSGVDINKKSHDILLPEYLANTIEALGHGRKKALQGRLVPDQLDMENYDRFGGGATEYYKSKKAFFGDPSSEDYGKALDDIAAKELLYDYATKFTTLNKYYRGRYSDDRYIDVYYDRLADEVAQEKYENQTVFDEAVQTLAGLPAGAAKGALDLIDVGQEMLTYLPQLAARVATGDDSIDIDLFDDGYKKAAIEFTDSLVGYDRKLDEIVMQDAMKDFEASGIDITSWESIKEAFNNPEKLSRLGAGAWKLLTDPSLTASMVTEVIGSGGALGGLAKAGGKIGSKVVPKAQKKISDVLQSNLTKLKAAVAAADTADKVAELQKNYTILQKIPDLLKGTVYTNADMMVRMNNDITAFKENNNGEDPSIGKLLQIATLNRVVSTAEVMSLKSLAGIKDIPAKVVKEATKKGVINAAGEAGFKLLKNGLMEGSQETLDSIVEQINQKVDSADFKGKNVSDVLSEASAEILTGTFAGVGSGVQVGAVGGIGNVTKGTVNAASAVSNAIRTPAADPANDIESAEAELKVANVVEANRKIREESTNPAASYYAGQGSGNLETIAAAKEEAKQAEKTILDGSNDVFNSDEEFSTKLSRLDPLIEIAVAENPNLTVEEIQTAVIKGLKAEGNTEQESEVVSTISKAHASGRQFASIKPLTETAKEVEKGSKGFLTYLTRAKAALAEGDTKEYESNLGELDRFYTYQTEKAKNLESGIEQVRNTIENEVDILVQQNKAASREEALDLVLERSVSKNDPLKDKSLKVLHSNNPNSKSSVVKYKDVIAKIKDPSYSRGIYSLVDTIQKEAKAIDVTYRSLVAAEESVAPDTVIVPEETTSVTAEVDSNTATTTTTEAITPASAEVESVETVPESSVTAMSDEEIASLEAFDTGREIEDSFDSEEEFEAQFAALEAEEENTSLFTEEDLAGMEEQVENAPMANEEALEFSAPVEKEEAVKVFNENLSSIKDIKQRITKRRAELRAQGITTKEEVVQDSELASLFAEKDRLEQQQDSLPNRVKESFNSRVQGFTSKIKPGLKYFDYNKPRGEQDTRTPIDKIFKAFRATGFTLANRTRGTATAATKKFADGLLKVMNVEDGKFSTRNGTAFVDNPITVFLFDENGKLNYNVVEALQAASYEFLVQEAGNLFGSKRDAEEIADIFGISKEEVTPEMFETFTNGGMTLKLAAPAIGQKIISHLGLVTENTQSKEVLATAFGIVGLKALEGEFLVSDSYSDAEVLRGDVAYVKGLSSLYNTAENRKVSNIYDVRSQLNYFEETLGVVLDKDRSYRRTKARANEKVRIHNSEYQEAPKDHKEVVNRLKNTPFSFNSGHSILVELFGKEDGTLDIIKLVERILGPEASLNNKDSKDRYEAQKAALTRDIQFYMDAQEDVGNGNLFFNWFIAKNHRIHLDSNRVNPQNDKHLSRWLLTTNNSRPNIQKTDIEAALSGKKASKEAIMFIYGIVQAFDGNKGVPGVDKDNEKEIIAAAKKLLEDTADSDLLAMIADADHVGHAALAVANIRKYMDSTTSFNSDMVLEVDGLTNGFAFRAMQFPLGAKAYRWLEKVGVIRKQSVMYDIESMNMAGSKGQEDVYISVGAAFQDKVIEATENLDETSKKWVKLFQEFGKLPDFSNKEDRDVKKFIRNLMKSPVMIFNYAAGKEKIAGGLVDDQVMGTGYLSNRGLIDALTELDTNKNYVIGEAKLKEVFGDTLGKRYHLARKSLETTSITSKKDQELVFLRKELTKAIRNTYKAPLEDTLEDLFSEQTSINKSITEAGQFMFEYFKDTYELWKLNNPTATDKEKTEYLRSIAQIVPGVAGASTDDQLNKVTFLKSILEPTNHSVQVRIGGKTTGTNTISRGYGDPGVGPAVLLVLAADSATLAKTINESYIGKEGFGALIVHDAMVLGANEFDTIGKYSMNFYSVNKNYSILQEFVNAVEGLEKLDPSMSQRSIYNKVAKKLVTFEEMKYDLTEKNAVVQNARKELFKGELKIGQMVGPEGSMVTVDPEEIKASAVAFVAKASETLLSRFKEPEVKKALGKSYNEVLSKVEKMLEGCK